MIFYIVLSIVSFGTAGYIVFKHRADLAHYYEVSAAEHPPRFAHFMEDISKEFRALWDTHMRAQILLFTEKQLRWFRINVLKVERLLFRATHHVRNAASRNSGDEITAEAGEKKKD